MQYLNILQFYNISDPMFQFQLFVRSLKKPIWAGTEVFQYLSTSLFVTRKYFLSLLLDTQEFPPFMDTIHTTLMMFATNNSLWFAPRYGIDLKEGDIDEVRAIADNEGEVGRKYE